MSSYASLVPELLARGGAEKDLPLSKLLDLIATRVTVVYEALGTPGVSVAETEFLRGRLAELRDMQKAFRTNTSGAS
jgi:hypothetical protein